MSADWETIVIAGVKNYQTMYRRIVNYWQWFDNTGHTPKLVDE